MLMGFYNLMTGSGFAEGAYSYDWYLAWVSLALLIIITYVLVVLSKNDYMGEYYWPASLMGVVAAALIIVFSGASKVALVIGIVVMLLFGYGYPRVFGSQ